MFCANTLTLEKTKHSLSWLRSAGLVILSSLLIGLFAKVAIPLPFSPIPLATQGLVVLILSVLLGPKRAAAAVIGFLMQGAAGFPVFAGGHASLFGPTGGYLFGYLAAAILVGTLAERMRERTPLKLFWVLAAGNAMFFLFGVPYLALFIGFKKALLLGLAPFVIGDLFKLVLGVKFLQRVRQAH
jgi:biotin transport system substrate-specific component